MARIKDRELERLWTQRLRQHAASGLSVTQFCARAGVACSAFYYWKRRLAAEPQPLPARPPLFVPLHVDLPAPEDHAQDAARGVEIVLPHQVRLRLDSLPEPEWITRLVSAAGWAPTTGGGTMIMLPATVRVFLCTRPTDMRKSFDGLSGLVQECFHQDVLTGHLFLFVNRRRDRIKLLHFDRDGLVIWYKRLEAGSFQMPGTTEPDGVELKPAELAMILSGIDLHSARQRKRFHAAC